MYYNTTDHILLNLALCLLTVSKFPGSYDLVTLIDEKKTKFTTRIDYVMPIGSNNKTFLTIPVGNGVKRTILEEREMKINAEEEED